MELLRFFCLIVLLKALLANSSPYLHRQASNSSHLQVNRLEEKEEEQYLVYECKFHCGGWADRLKGIMSVYALSLLTNRRFLIDIRTPCNFSQLFMPNTVEWRASANNVLINSIDTMFHLIALLPCS